MLRNYFIFPVIKYCPKMFRFAASISIFVATVSFASFPFFILRKAAFLARIIAFGSIRVLQELGRSGISEGETPQVLK